MADAPVTTSAVPVQMEKREAALRYGVRDDMAPEWVGLNVLVFESVGYYACKKYTVDMEEGWDLEVLIVAIYIIPPTKPALSLTFAQYTMPTATSMITILTGLGSR